MIAQSQFEPIENVAYLASRTTLAKLAEPFKTLADLLKPYDHVLQDMVNDTRSNNGGTERLQLLRLLRMAPGLGRAQVQQQLFLIYLGQRIRTAWLGQGFVREFLLKAEDRFGEIKV